MGNAYEAGTTTTDSNGAYTFSNANANDNIEGYLVKASKDGYTEATSESFSVESNVTVKDITLNAATTTYDITVTSGTASPNPAAGATVTLTANAAPSGQRFKEWTISPSVTFADGTGKTSATAKFTMPGQAVSAEAIYENIPDGVTAVTGVTLNKISLSLYSNTTPNTATLTATASPVDATDKTVTWASGNRSVATVDANGTVKAIGNGTAIITATTIDGGYTANCTVTVSTYSSGGLGGGSSSGGSSYTPPVITEKPADQPNAPANAETKVETKVDATGKAAVNVPEKVISNAIKAAQDAAKKAGTEKNGISVTVNLQTDKAASSITATLPADAVDALIKAGVTEVKIQSSTVSVTLDLATLKAAQAAAGGAITVSAAKQDVSKLSAAAQAAIGNRPAFSFILTSGGKPVTNFGGGTVTLAIPYTPQEGEDTGKLGIVYVDDNGGVTYLTDSSYDPNTKTMITRTGHFSVFGVGYKTDMLERFTDLQLGAWYNEAVAYALEHGLFAGTSDTTFSPNAAMTRAMLATVLYRAAGEPDMEDENWGYPFTDVDAESWYGIAVYWARQKGITTGTGAETFLPDGSITREQLAVMLYRYAGSPAANGTLDGFIDAHETSGYAADALRWAVEQDIVTGKGGGILDPKGKATRAQVAAMLMRYLTLTNR